MPTPREGESRKDYIQRCMVIVSREGIHNTAHAFAKCNGMYEQWLRHKHGKAQAMDIPDTMPFGELSMEENNPLIRD